MGAVSGVNGVYVVVDEKGSVFFVDGTQGGKLRTTTLDGRAPYSVECSTSHGGSIETCIVTDSGGKVWRGPCRADGRTFQPVSQTFSIEPSKD